MRKKSSTASAVSGRLWFVGYTPIKIIMVFMAKRKGGGGGRHYWLGCSFRASVLDVPKRVLSLKWMKLHNNIVSLSASLR